MQQIKKNKKDNADTLRRNLEDKLPKNVRQIGKCCWKHKDIHTGICFKLPEKKA